jgi:hypothetical protein
MVRKGAWAGVAAVGVLLAQSAGASTTYGAAATGPGGRLGINGAILRENCSGPKGWACHRIIPDEKPFAEEGKAFAWSDKLTFVFGAELLSEHGIYEGSRESVRFTLPPGLSWAGPGPALPASAWTFTPISQSCTTAGQVATCEVDGVPSGTQRFTWLFDVAAKRSGYYSLTIEIGNREVNHPPREYTPELVHLKILVRDGGDKLPGPVTSKRYLLNTRLGKGAHALHGLRVLELVYKGGLPVRPSTDPSCTAAIGKRRLVRGRDLGDGLRPGHYFSNGFHGVWLDAGYGWAFCNIHLSPVMLKKNHGKRLTGTISFKVGKTKVKQRYSARIVAKGDWIAHPPPPPPPP